MKKYFFVLFLLIQVNGAQATISSNLFENYDSFQKEVCNNVKTLKISKRNKDDIRQLKSIIKKIHKKTKKERNEIGLSKQSLHKTAQHPDYQIYNANKSSTYVALHTAHGYIYNSLFALRSNLNDLYKKIFKSVLKQENLSKNRFLKLLKRAGLD